MPTYEFRCPSCQSLDSLVTTTIPEGEPALTCETCDVPMRRVYSVPAITYEGSGWAKTDRRAGR